MKASFLKTSFILLSVILTLGFVVTRELEKIKISKLDLPDGTLATNFFYYMEQQNRHYVKQSQITLANRPFKIILGFHPEREFYIYDMEKRFCPYWLGSKSLYSYHNIDDKLYII